LTAEELCEQWDDLDPDERLQSLEDIASGYLVDHGYDNVDVQRADLDEGVAAETDPVTGDIVFDDESLRDMDADEALETLFHETWHSMDVQDGVLDRLPEDEQEAINEIIGMEGYFDDQGELRMRDVYFVPEHDNAETFGEEMSNAACPDDDEPAPPSPSGPPSGSESASEGFQVEIDWAHITVTGEFTFEPDFDNAVVTTEAASDNPGGEAEFFEGGHAVPSP
jgi:hypothetical protein